MSADVRVVGPQTINASGSDTVPPQFTLTFTVTPSSATVSVGTAVQLVTKLDSNGVTLIKPVVWSTSDATVESVSGNGLATALKQGSATVTAASGGLASSTTFSVVAVPVATVAVSPGLDTLHLGSAIQLTATTKDANGSTLFGRLVAWASSSPGVASVDGTGKVLALAAGTTTITATSEGISGTASIVAVFVPVATVTVTAVTDTVQIGQTATFTAITKDAGGNVLTGELVTWTSNDTTVATVNSVGQVTGRAVGSVVITATSEGKSGTHALTVVRVPVASVQVAPSSTGLFVGATTTLTATPRDANGGLLTGRTVTWASGKPATASVGVSTGLVTGLDTGTVVITATAEGKTGTSTVTVSKQGEPEPTLLGTDVVAYVDSFTRYTSTSNLVASFANKQSHGSIALDTTTFPGNKTYRVTYNNDGCLGSSDADVGIEKTTSDPSAPTRDWFVQYQVAYQPGYQFWWGANIGSCPRGNASKEYIIFRDPNNSTGGRISILANNEAACPAIYGSLNQMSWNVTIDKQTGNTLPTSCGSQRIKQHLALATKSPDAIADGQFHRITFHFRKESGADVGDGVVRMWVDGVLVIDYDGGDPSNPAYHQTYTRQNDFGWPMAFPTVLNSGAPQLESRWLDNLLVWYRP
jgi:uncharacterized protein YjdB